MFPWLFSDPDARRIRIDFKTVSKTFHKISKVPSSTVLFQYCKKTRTLTLSTKTHKVHEYATHYQEVAAYHLSYNTKN